MLGLVACPAQDIADVSIAASLRRNDGKGTY